MPTHARLTFSQPGAPPEPQRTRVNVGVSSREHALLVRVAAAAGFLGQEALEPRFVEMPAHHAVPRLVTADIDVAVFDLATFLGERALGWDGLVIACFGPLADRSVGVAAVEAATWEQRRDTCERLVRACARALSLVTPELLAAGAASWWSDCRPEAREVSLSARWSAGRTPPALRGGLAWTR